MLCNKPTAGLLISWCLVSIQFAAVLAQSAPQLGPQAAAGRGWGSSGPAPAPAKAVATPSAVAALTQALLSISAPERPAPVNSISNDTLPYKPGQLLVKFKNLDGGNYSALVDLVNAWAGIDLIKVMAGTGIAVVNISDGVSAQRKAARLSNSELVDFAEVDYLMKGDGSTYQMPWALQKLQVYPVWNQYTFGDCSVAVCHIDSGLPWGSNNWYNPGEYSGLPNVDDDGNGVVDDYFGANFVDPSQGNVSWDLHGHGSGTGGTLGGANDGNPNSPLGVAPKVTMMPCKAMDTNLNVPFSAAVSCIEWCKNNFENIATMGGRQRTGIYVTAWGANSVADSESLRAVIQRVDSLGRTRALFTSSAGNTQSPSHVPGSLGLSNIVSLTFSDSNDRIGGNTGSWIDVAAPTQSSSDATAVGGGLAALMVAANPSLTPEQMKAAMRSGVDVLSTTVGRVGSNGRLNAYKAFQYLEGQGLVQKARSMPDQARVCDPVSVWSPAWPRSRLGCSVGGTNQCWTSYSSQY